MTNSHSFLKNKKIAGILKEAIDSPVGSTKRARARQLVLVLRKLSDKHYGGQGGPGYRYSPTAPGGPTVNTKAPRKDRDFSNMIIFPSPPAPHRGRPMTRSMTPPGQNAQAGVNYSMANQPAQTPYIPGQTAPAQSPSPQSNMNPYAAMPSISGAYSNISGINGVGASNASIPSQIASTLGQVTPTTGTGQGGPGDTTGSSALDSAWTTNQPSSSLGGNMSLGSLAGVGQVPVPKFSLPNLSLPTGAPSPTVPSPSSTSQLSVSGFSPSSYPNLQSSLGFQPSTAQPVTPQPTSTSQPTTPLTSVGSAGQSLGGGSQQPSSTSQPQSPTSGGSSTGSTSGGSSTGSTSGGSSTGSTSSPYSAYPSMSSVLSMLPPVDYSKYTTGLPKEAGAAVSSAVQNNLGATAFASQTMANPALLKEIFGSAADSVPASGSLTDAVKALETSLTQKYNIPGLESQMQQMIANGVTLGPMIQTYIQNQDTSLNSIHDQIQNAQNQMLHADTGNPYEASIWGRYMDYLNNLYTSQNTSYADFYNKSVDMYNNALSAMNTTMSNAINQYNSELNTGAQLTQADFNRINQSLTDMYTAVQQAPVQQAELGTLQAQLAQTYYSALGGGLSTTGQGNWAAEYKKLVDDGVLFTNTKATSTRSGNVGELQPNVTSLSTALRTILSDNPKVGTDGALYILGQAFQKTLDGSSSSPDTLTKRLDQLQQLIGGGVADGVVDQQTAAAMQGALASEAAKKLYTYYTTGAGSANVNDVKNAVIYAMTGGGTGWFGSGKPPTSYTQITKNFPTIPTALARQILDAVGQTRSMVGTQTQGGLTPDQVMQQYANNVRALQTPADIASLIGNMVGALYGAQPVSDFSNADITTVDLGGVGANPQPDLTSLFQSQNTGGGASGSATGG